MAQELNAFPHAFSTWVSQGGGLRSDRKGTMRYNSGPMKGMTRDQAQMMFTNTVWRNASPEWKNEYGKRATTGMMSPAETAEFKQAQAQQAQAMPPAAATGQQRTSVTPPSPAPAPGAEQKPASTMVSNEPVPFRGPPASAASKVASVTPPTPSAAAPTPAVASAPAPRLIAGGFTAPTPPAPAPAMPLPAATPNPAGKTKASRGEMPRPAQPWSPSDNMQGGKFKTSDQVLAESAQPSAAYVAKTQPAMPVTPPVMAAAPKPAAATAPQPAMPSAVASPATVATAAPVKPAMPVTPPVMQPVGTQTEDKLTNEDMSGQGYTLIGSSGGVKKWRRGAAMDNANATAAAKTQANIDRSPILASVSPPKAKPVPFETTFDATKGRVVPTSGTPDAAFASYDQAQTRVKANGGSAADRAKVTGYVEADPLSRQPAQIARDKAEQSAGMTQAGRYAGPDRNSPEYASKIKSVRRPQFVGM